MSACMMAWVGGDEEGSQEFWSLRPVRKSPQPQSPRLSIFLLASHPPPLLPTQAGRRRGAVMAGAQQGLGGRGGWQ